MIRLILVIILIIIFAIYSIFDAIICFIFSIFNKNAAKVFSSKAVKILFKLIIFVSGVRLHISGIENIDESCPIFVVSNHRGFFDIIIGYTLLDKPCGFVAKDYFEKIPFLSYWMKKIDCLFLDRKDLRSGAMMVVNAIKKLQEGTSMWLCPEGTRNKTPDSVLLLDFKGGAFKIPEKTGAPILPIAFYNTEKVLESQKPLIRSADVYVKIGKMYRISDLSESDRLDVGLYSQNLIKNMLLRVKDENDR